MFARRRDTDKGPGTGAPNANVRSSRPHRDPVDVLTQQMALARLARLCQDWPAYERARNNAVRLILSHRIEDEVSRFSQVMTACTGWQNMGEDARQLILKRLSNAFIQGIERGESAHDVIVRMHRIPRAGATAALASEMRRGDGQACVRLLLCEGRHVADDVRAAFGDDPAQIAARLTNRDWANFATALLAIAPGEPPDVVVAAARSSLRRTLTEIASRERH